MNNMNRNPVEQNAFDSFAGLMANLMVKYGPRIILKKQKDIKKLLRAWDFSMRPRKAERTSLLTRYQEKYDEANHKK